MFPLLRAEVRRIVGRRGSFWGAIIFALIIVGITILADNPETGSEALDHISTGGRYAGLLGVVIIGALAGSYDTANGTMRYLVLTGVPRWKLALVRIAGIMVAVLPMAILILGIGLIASSGNDGGAPTGNAVPDAVWAVLSTLWTWGIVSVAVGMLMRSNGPAIAVSVVLFFGGTLITGLVSEFISDTLANYLLPAVFEQVASLTSGGDDDYKISLATAFVVLAAWLVGLAGLAVARVQRDEY